MGIKFKLNYFVIWLLLHFILTLGPLPGVNHCLYFTLDFLLYCKLSSFCITKCILVSAYEPTLERDNQILCIWITINHLWKLRTISELIDKTFAFMSWWYIFLVSPPKNLKSIRILKKKSIHKDTDKSIFKSQHTLFHNSLEKKYMIRFLHIFYFTEISSQTRK